MRNTCLFCLASLRLIGVCGAGMTWFLQVCGIVMGIHGGVDGDMSGPFFYSRTSCCGQSGTPSELPSHFDVKYPKTCTDYHICPPNVTHLTIKACDVPLLSPDDSSWSHSAYCPSWDYVKTFTQKLGANRAALLSTTSLVFMPIGAGLADRRGRKAIFFFGHLLSMKSLLCNLLSSLPFFIHLDPNAYLLYASSILSSLNSGSGPTSMAMMVDLIPGDMREQGFPILRLFNIPGVCPPIDSPAAGIIPIDRCCQQASLWCSPSAIRCWRCTSPTTHSSGRSPSALTSFASLSSSSSCRYEFLTEI